MENMTLLKYADDTVFVVNLVILTVLRVLMKTVLSFL